MNCKERVKNPLIEALATLFEKKQLKQQVSITHVKEAVAKISKRFSAFEQEDAHEFLMSLLDQCRLRDVKELDPISHFTFMIKNTVECSQCFHKVDKLEEHLDLSLDLLNPTIESLIDSFLKSEDVEYKCEACFSKKAQIHHQIESTPVILLLHLKRFGNSFVKRQDPIDIPLDLELGNQKYRLTGFISHLGSSISKGHYIFDYLNRDGHWTRFDDTFVSHLRGLEHRSRDAYIIMYQAVL
jgi:uncharacterized UBP type Zn finger protein